MMALIHLRPAMWAALIASLLLTNVAAVASGSSADNDGPGVMVAGIDPGDVVTESLLTLTVEPVGYELSTAGAGGANVDGFGHYHVHVDGALNGVYTEPEAIVVLRHLAPGPHVLAIMPARNDHSELPERAMTIEFEYRPTAIETVTIALREWSLDPSDVTLTAGTYTFVAPNEGAIDHSLLIVGDGLGAGTTEVRYPSGVSQSFTVDLAPGTYEMLCPLPWHKSTGMVGQITVVP